MRFDLLVLCTAPDRVDSSSPQLAVDARGRGGGSAPRHRPRPGRLLGPAGRPGECLRRAGRGRARPGPDGVRGGGAQPARARRVRGAAGRAGGTGGGWRR
jgi:hypothetical protein